MEDKCVFIQDDLDDVTLTEEEIQDLHENYKYFENFRDSDSDSSGSPPVSQSPPKALTQDEVAKQETLCAEFGRLSHKDEPLVPFTLPEIAAICPSHWNDTKGLASSVYSVFGVSSYIVDPNYLLCISKHSTSLPWFQESSNTINNLLCTIGDNTQTVDMTKGFDVPDMTFPNWVHVEDNLLDVLDVFSSEICKCIPDSLDDPAAATKFLHDFMHFINRKKKHFWKSHGNAKSNFLHELESVCVQLKEVLMNMMEDNKIKKTNQSEVNTPGAEKSEMDKSKNVKSIPESLFERYFNLLMDLFKQITLIPLTLHPKSKIPFNISPRSVCKAEPFKGVIPDFQITLLSEVMLIGEVKTFGSKGLRLHQSHKGHRVKSDDASSKTATATQVTQKSPNPKHDPRHYRHLDKAENYKVRKFLPQLIAEMLACRSASKKYFDIGQLNENIQMGFAMEGFKLRFVRMVICNNGSLKRPTVNDLITDNRVKCDMYLTQEFNLFKKSHIIMVFQILLALSYHCHEKLVILEF